MEQQDEHMLISDWNTQGCVRGCNVAALSRKVKSRVWSESGRLKYSPVVNIIYVSDCGGCDFELHDLQLHAFAEATGITLRLHAGEEPDTSSGVRPRVVAAAASGAVSSSPDARQTQAITSMIVQCSKTAVFLHEQELVMKPFAEANNYLSQFFFFFGNYGLNQVVDSAVCPSGTVKKV